MASVQDLLAWLESRRSPPYKVLSHGEDLDGLASAAVFLTAVDGFAKTRFLGPSTAMRSRESFDVVMDLPAPAGGCLLTIDHHKSNVLLAKERSEKAFVRPDYPSTALLAWELFREEAELEHLKPLVDLTSMVDTGNYDEGTVRFTAAVKRIFSTSKRDSELHKVVIELIERIPEDGRGLISLESILPHWEAIEHEEAGILSWISSLPGLVKDGRNVALLAWLGRRSGYLTPLIHYQVQPLVDLSATLRIGEDNRVRISLRSRMGSRASALHVASSVSGGGHERAAGASVDQKDMDWLIKMLEERGMRVVIAKPPENL